MNRKRLMITMMAISVLVITGCSHKEAAPVSQEPEPLPRMARMALLTPDPEGAANAIYAQESLADVSTEQLDESRMQEVLVNPEFRAEELYAFYSNPKSGLADLVIAKPYEEDQDQMFNWLYRYQERRIAEFENYDILDSKEISKNAVVYQQGDYTIMLMFSDNEAAQNIIDEYIQ